MEHIPVSPALSQFPAVFHPLVKDCPVYQSNGASGAQVYFLDREGGLYLKSGPKGALETEAAMTRYFHSKGLSAEVLAYESEDSDWLLTRRVPGQDCTHADHLRDPIRLADILGQLLRQLHELEPKDCPVPNRNETYCATASRNFRHGNYDTSLFPDNWGYTSPEQAWQVIEENRHLLRTDALLHGDYCLPNVILNDWRFSGFIDLGNGGVGDRHIDLFWGAWTLHFNLKTDKYRSRFLDAYGRDAIREEMFPIIAAFEVFG